MQKFIGNIVVAAGTSVNNLTTATPFNIPVGTNSCIVLASGADCYAEMLRGTSAIATTAAAGEPIGTSQFQLAATPTAGTAIGQSPNVLCVFNNNAASRTTQVWAIDA
jgi:hypothetical protein